MRTNAARRQMASTMSVNRIRDFSSGILKQLLKVLAIAASMLMSYKIRNPKSEGRKRDWGRILEFRHSDWFGQLHLSLRGGLYHLFRANDLTSAAFGFDLGASRGAEGMGADGQFPGQFSAAKNFDSGSSA